MVLSHMFDNPRVLKYYHNFSVDKRIYISYYIYIVARTIPADMAELADAHGSGSCESNFM